MKPIERGEVLGIADYELIRERFRARVIEEKKLRRVALGPKVSVTFENRDTVLLQIQEMLRTERITREGAILHEIETYNQLLPGPRELSCTLMIEIAETIVRDEFLVAAEGIEKSVAIVVGGERFAATWDKAREIAGRTSAVHYLKFPLNEMATERLIASITPNATVTRIYLRVDHPAYQAQAPLSIPTIASLAEDLAEETGA
jgi:hypothetical protein